MNTLQELANWCRDERDEAEKRNEAMRRGAMGFYSIVGGERRDDTPGMIAHNESIIARMDALIAKMEAEHGIRPA